MQIGGEQTSKKTMGEFRLSLNHIWFILFLFFVIKSNVNAEEACVVVKTIEKAGFKCRLVLVEKMNTYLEHTLDKVKFGRPIWSLSSPWNLDDM